MVTRALYSSVLALLLFTGHALSQTTTAPVSSTAPSSAPESTSTFVSPSLNQGNGGGLSQNAKIGISVGVTLGVIILLGSIAIFCIKRGRDRALARPQTRTELHGEIHGEVDEENTPVGEDPGKSQEVYYMSGPSTAHNGMLPQPPDGFIYQGEYPMIPDQVYVPQQQAYPIIYPTAYPGDTYGYSGTAYPGTVIMDPNQQNGYAGPSNTTQYISEAHIQPQHQLHHQRSDISWTYPVSTMSPIETPPVQDLQYTYLQDYQHHTQSPSPDQNHYHPNGDLGSGQGYGEDAYYVPPPHPHASELPDQRKPVELMGEGHYKEAP
ncbi:hypothetical protein ONZ43_g7221 [Nemania bipapillata]|uniref:Uncharacterized protein n=1 Tax=Nemania bipapillata TaxID=110536 RepID=A0ACC2HSA2_9PEZI|nr:hypothetical protein ONZ43_g7221 [Nemania bipapillata]